MSLVHKLSIISGISLILLGSIHGIWIAHSESNVARLTVKDGYGSMVSAIANTESFKAAKSRSDQHAKRYQKRIAFHAHVLNMSTLLIVMSLISVALNASLSERFLGALVCGAWLYPFGLFLLTVEMEVIGRLFAGFGAVLSLAAICALFVSFRECLRTQ